MLGRARLRQKVANRPPCSIPAPLWDELFTAMGCELDRALLDCYVLAEELLGVGTGDIHWAKPGLYVISKRHSGARTRADLTGGVCQVGPLTGQHRHAAGR